MLNENFRKRHETAWLPVDIYNVTLIVTRISYSACKHIATNLR